MATVVKRTFRSCPFRDGIKTWNAIAQMLMVVKNQQNERELLSVAGIVASVITDHYVQNSPIIVTCDGPRTRIYCTYDEDALDGTDENESALGFDPLNGSWAISIPCHKEDLNWVQAALKKLSAKITARDLDVDALAEGDVKQNSNNLKLNPDGFIGK